MKTIITIFCVLILVGCSEQSNSNANIEILAIVNGDKISSYTLQNELKASQQNKDDQVVTRKVFAGLIDRQLLAQEALKLDLERAPEVIQAIESAKAKIYAQAYLSKKIAKLLPASEVEINQFIESHPYKFRHRKVFKMQDVVFSNDQLLLDLSSVEKDVSTSAELQAILNAKGINFEVGDSQIFTDRLPEHVLKKIQPMKKGDLLFLHRNNSITVKSIEDIIEQPITDNNARLLASHLLDQQRQQELITQEIARLKGLATIEVLDPKLIEHSKAVNN